MPDDIYPDDNIKHPDLATLRTVQCTMTQFIGIVESYLLVKSADIINCHGEVLGFGFGSIGTWPGP